MKWLVGTQWETVAKVEESGKIEMFLDGKTYWGELIDGTRLAKNFDELLC